MELTRTRLQSFLAVADHLHFGRAADQLHVSQQALSSAIRRLESDLGVALFERDTRRVRLTPAGETLAREAAAVLAEVDRVVAHVRAAGRGPSATVHLTVGTGAEGTAFVHQVVDRLRGLRPHMSVHTRHTFGDHLAALRSEEADLALEYLPFSRDDLRGLRALVVSEEPVAVYVASHHRLAGAASVSVDDILDETWLDVTGRGFLPAWVDFWTLRPQRRRSGRGHTLVAAMGSYEDVAAAIARGDAVALAPGSSSAYYPGRDIVAVPVTDVPPGRTALLWRAGPMSRPVRTFLEGARQVVRQRSAG